MREMISMVVVLTVLSAFSGGLLAALKDGTKERIENQELSLVKGPAVQTILKGASNDPVADRFKMKVGDTEKTFFVGIYDGKPNTVAFEVSGNGYGDKIGVMVGVDVDDDKMVGLGVTTHKETPGLGANAKDDPKFAAQFRGKALGQPFKVTTDGGEINAISGATITSRGVCRAATQAAEMYKQIKPELIAKLKEVKP
jgi:electron transport complex protein RnfG